MSLVARRWSRGLSVPSADILLAKQWPRPNAPFPGKRFTPCTAILWGLVTRAGRLSCGSSAFGTADPLPTGRYAPTKGARYFSLPWRASTAMGTAARSTKIPCRRYLGPKKQLVPVAVRLTPPASSSKNGRNGISAWCQRKASPCGSGTHRCRISSYLVPQYR